MTTELLCPDCGYKAPGESTYRFHLTRICSREAKLAALIREQEIDDKYSYRYTWWKDYISNWVEDGQPVRVLKTSIYADRGTGMLVNRLRGPDLII